MTLTNIVNTENITVPYSYNPDAPVGASANVIDKYKNYLTEAVRLDLDTNRSALINVCVNTGSDFNLSSVIRSGNAFGVRATIISGRRQWDRRGAVGTHNYEHVRQGPDIFEIIENLMSDGYTVIPVDNTPEFNPVSIFEVDFPKKTAFLYGEEGCGLDLEVVEKCNFAPVYLPQGGSVRSLNVACAATVFMYEYARQWPTNWQS